MTNIQLRLLEQVQYHDSVLIQLIDWQGQGTVTWSVIFLTVTTIFFMIILDLHPKQNNSESGSQWNRYADILLSVLALLFLVGAILSIFQMSYYYRYISYLYEQLSIIGPKGWLYRLIFDYWFIERVMPFSSVIVFLALLFKLRQITWSIIFLSLLMFCTFALILNFPEPFLQMNLEIIGILLAIIGILLAIAIPVVFEQWKKPDLDIVSINEEGNGGS